MTGYLWHGKPDLEIMNAEIMSQRPPDRKVAVGHSPGWGGFRPKLTPFFPCGTNAAYERHLRNDEKIDRACLSAHREYQAEKARARRQLRRELLATGYARETEQCG